MPLLVTQNEYNLWDKLNKAFLHKWVTFKIFENNVGKWKLQQIMDDSKFDRRC